MQVDARAEAECEMGHGRRARGVMVSPFTMVLVVGVGQTTNDKLHDKRFVFLSCLLTFDSLRVSCVSCTSTGTCNSTLQTVNRKPRTKNGQSAIREAFHKNVL